MKKVNLFVETYFTKSIKGVTMDVAYWGDMLEKLVIVYFVISIVLEVLEIIFMFTPSKEDDRIIAKVQGWWSVSRKYFLLASVRTPVARVFTLIFNTLTCIKQFIKSKLKSDKNS
jgi:hypothetical protein